MAERKPRKKGTPDLHGDLATDSKTTPPTNPRVWSSGGNRPQLSQLLSTTSLSLISSKTLSNPPAKSKTQEISENKALSVYDLFSDEDETPLPKKTAPSQAKTSKSATSTAKGKKVKEQPADQQTKTKSKSKKGDSKFEDGKQNDSPVSKVTKRGKKSPAKELPKSKRSSKKVVPPPSAKEPTKKRGRPRKQAVVSPVPDHPVPSEEEVEENEPEDEVQAMTLSKAREASPRVGRKRGAGRARKKDTSAPKRSKKVKEPTKVLEDVESTEKAPEEDLDLSKDGGDTSNERTPVKEGKDSAVCDDKEQQIEEEADTNQQEVRTRRRRNWVKAKVTPTITKVTDAKVPEEQEGGDDVESEEQAVTTQMEDGGVTDNDPNSKPATSQRPESDREDQSDWMDTDNVAMETNGKPQKMSKPDGDVTMSVAMETNGKHQKKPDGDVTMSVAMEKVTPVSPSKAAPVSPLKVTATTPLKDPSPSPRKDVKSLTFLASRQPSLVKSPSWPKSRGDALQKSRILHKSAIKKSRPSNLTQKEKGEKQMFFEELFYLLDNFVPAQPTSLRSFSIATMATNCQKVEFRKRLNQYQLAPRIMNCLRDAPTNSLLRLSTSLLFFMLTRDLHPLYFDKRCFELMANILEAEVKLESEMLAEGQVEGVDQRDKKSYNMLSKKIKFCLDKWSREYYISTSGREQADQIPTDKMSSGDLITEALISVTNPKRVQHFKNVLRFIGVLDPIVRRVMLLIRVADRLPPSDQISGELDLLLRRLQKLLLILEQVTMNSYDNQCYFVVFEGSALLSSLCKLLRYLTELVCAVRGAAEGEEEGYSDGYLAVNCLMGLLKFLNGVTHDNEMAVIRLGENAGVMDLAIKTILDLPSVLLGEDKFFVRILGLTLLINLTEHSPIERGAFRKPWFGCSERDDKGKSVLKQILRLFLLHYEASDQVDISLPKMMERPTDTPTKSIPLTPEPVGVGVSTTPTATGHAQPEQDPTAPLPPVPAKEEQSRSQPEAKFSLDESIEFLSDEEEDPSISAHEQSIADLSTSLVINREEFNQALEQAGQHLEDSMIACNCALLLGLLARHDRAYKEEIRNCLPSKSFDEMIKILQNFLSFLDYAKLGSKSGTQTVQSIVGFLKEENVQQQKSVSSLES